MRKLIVNELIEEEGVRKERNMRSIGAITPELWTRLKGDRVEDRACQVHRRILENLYQPKGF